MVSRDSFQRDCQLKVQLIDNMTSNMKKQSQTNISAILAGAIAFALACNINAGTFSSSTNPPVVDVTDIANLAPQTGSDKWFFQSANESGVTDAAKGQTFTNGPKEMLLRAITYKIDPTQKKAAPTTYTVRVGTVSGTNFTLVASEVFTQTVDTAVGAYMTWTLDSPVPLMPNTTYGVDVAMKSGTAWQTGIPYLSYTANTNIPGVGYYYDSGDMGVGTNNIVINASRDRVFHLDLEPIEQSPITITNQPVDATVNEHQTATFTVGVSGLPQYFQWYRQIESVSQPITGAVYATLALTNVTPADAGTYFVVITNSVSAVTSSPVTLTVIPDTAPPTLLSAEGHGDMNRIYLVFSEPVGTNCIANLSQYSVQMENDGPTLTILNAALYSSNVVMLTTSDRVFTSNYIVQVSGVCDTALTPNTMTQTSLWLSIESAFSSSTFAPVVDATDIANLAPQTGSDKWFFQSANESGVTDAAKGQTFTNGPLPTLLRAFTYKIDPTQRKTAPTTYTLRIGTVSETNFTLVASQIYTQTVDTPFGAYMTWILDPPVLLDPNVTYGIDVAMISGTVWNTGIPYLSYTANTNIPGVGYYYDSGDMGVGTNNIVINTSRDRVFHLDLVPYPPTPITITNQPVDATVDEHQTATFIVGVSGLPRHFQWYRQIETVSQPITGANSGTLTINNVTAADAGTYFVVITNSVSAVTSSPVTLTVIPDTAPPTLLSAEGRGEMNRIYLVFSEPVGTDCIGNLSQYSVQMTNNGPMLSILSASLYSSNVVVLTTSDRVFSSNYLVQVSGICDTASTPNTMTQTSLWLTLEPNWMLISQNSQWRYYTNIFEPTPGYRDFSYPDEDNWPTGLPLFGLEDPGVYPWPILTPWPVSQNNPAYLARIHFNFPFNPAGVVLVSSNYVDDGVAYWLNGQPVGMIGFDPATVPTQNDIYWNTPAQNAPEGQNRVLFFAPGALQQGENVLVAEVHQASPNGSDVAFGMLLVALMPKPIVITNQPQNQNVIEMRDATFTVGVDGSTPAYQWYYTNAGGIILLTDQTNATLVISSVTSANAGGYFVVVTNVLGAVTSQVATLSVTADLTPPTLLSARITGQNMITVTFDENVDPVSASDPMNYTVQDADGNSIMFYLVEVSGSNVTISLSAFVNSNIEYVVTAETIGDLVNPPNIMTIGTVRTGRKLTLIGLSSSWSYNDTGANLGTAWREYTYPEESSWPTATAWLGFETNTFITINNLTHISTNTNAGIGGTIITYYFRQHFNFDGDPAAATLLLEYGFDDGGIVYLNGHRVFSLNMTNAEYSYTNYTDVTGNEVTAVSVTNIPNTYLRRGDNVIAVEVHQDNRTSSDLVFGLALHADVLPSTTIVPPTIRVQPPASSYVSVNSNLTLSVVAQATAPFSYQWYLNGTELALMTDSTLVIGNAQSANEGQYWVVVSNAAGVATSQVAQVTVLEVPVITHQPAGMNVAVGGTAVFAVEVNGRLLSYQWYHVTETATNLLAGKTNATLTITNVQGANAGGYYVVVRDPVHTVTSATAQLMIGAVTRPQIVGDRSNRTVATLQFITEPGVVYTLQRAMSMSLPITWQDVPGPGATVTGDGTLKTLTDADASVPHRFYRVKATTP